MFHFPKVENCKRRKKINQIESVMRLVHNIVLEKRKSRKLLAGRECLHISEILKAIIGQDQSLPKVRTSSIAKQSYLQIWELGAKAFYDRRDAIV